METQLKIIETAFSQYGLTELPGSVDNNKEIMKFFHEIGHVWVKTDETAWCAAYVNWVLKKSCALYSGDLDAKSFLDVGVKVDEFQLGDIAVFDRGREPWMGHVGFPIKDDKYHIYLLGGNQRNSVNISPYLKSKFIEYRRCW